MNSEGPVVSLAVLAAGRLDRLPGTLESLAKQTHRPVEILVVSGPEATETVESFRSGLPEGVSLHALFGDPPRGRAMAMQKGLQAASGAFVGFLDAGVRLHPEHAEALSTCLEQSERIGCYSDAERCPPGTGGEADCTPLESLDFDPLELLLRNYIPLPTLLFRRQTLIDLGGVDARFEGDPVWDVLLRIAAGGALYHVPRITVQLPAEGIETEGPGAAEGRKALYARHGHLLSADLMERVASMRRELGSLGRTVEALEEELGEERRLRRLLADALDASKAAQGALGRRLRELEAAHRALEVKYEAASEQLQRILDSRAWRFVRTYGEVRNRLRPRLPASGQRAVRRGVEILDKEGVQGIKRRLTQSMTLAKVDRGRYPFQPVEPQQVALELPSDPLKASISVIIPTKDAGPEFRRTLRRIRSQVGVSDLEILVIDSGSSDGTVAAAQAEGARVLQIPPESFHHAQTRNQAARHARGDILVFTVQDASPAAPDWLYRLVSPVLRGEADVVSARQIPRADADLYALVATWGFHRYLGFERDTLRRGVSLDGRPMDERRRLAHLDNVCLAIGRALHAEYPFGGRFAEDLDLGRRLLEAGFGLLHQVDNAVVHSHTRAARYFFLRAYVDLRSLFGIFEEAQPPSRTTVEAAFPTLAWAYTAFAQAVWDWLTTATEAARSPREALQDFSHRLGEAFENDAPQTVSPAWDASLFQTFAGHLPGGRDEAMLEDVRQELLAQLAPLSKYLSVRADWGCPMEEVSAALHKVFASAAGCVLARAGVELPADLVRGI